MTPRPEPTPVDLFKRWLEATDPDAPATRIYHTGWLVADVETAPAVRELAAAVLHASGALPPTRRTGTGRNGQVIQPPAGPALVELSQRRLGPGKYEYVARKLPRRHREDPTR